MVLSNKKLKQKLREAKAQSLLSNESNGKELHKNQETSKLEELLKASRLSNKIKKRTKINDTQLQNRQEYNVVEEKIEKGLVGENQRNEKNKKKRKRDNQDKSNGVAKESKNKKSKQKQKKKKNVKKVKNAGGEVNDVVQATSLASESQVSEDFGTKVYVGGVPYYSTEDDIRSFFESCGTITEVDCMIFPDSGKFRGIAIIGFKTDAAAKRALALDGSDMGGFFLKIQPYKSTRTPQVKKVSNFSPKIVEGYNRIYVGNLSWEITEDDLKKFFSGCDISSIRWGTDKETGEFRGYGHVDFSDNFSLLMALKLDQQIVCGRPIKISCAVPLKGGKVPSTSAPTSTATQADDDGLAADSGKMKRRTCYECNEKGHLSADCPKKLATAAPTSTATNNVVDVPATTNSAAPNDISNEVDNDGLAASSGKIRRRTCYECHQKGHVSTDCPNKLPTATPTASASDTNARSVTAESVVDDYGNTRSNVAKDTGNAVDNDGLTASSGKMRRRTCYECHQKGHVSTACPNKVTTAAGTAVATATATAPVAVTYNEPNINESSNTPKNIGNVTDNDGSAARSGKMKRRTCYECHQKGHVSTDCPNRKTTETNSNASQAFT